MVFKRIVCLPFAKVSFGILDAFSHDSSPLKLALRWEEVLSLVNAEEKSWNVSPPHAARFGGWCPSHFWFHLPPQMTIILGHSLQVKALGPKKECPYDVHRRFVSCNLRRCTLRLYPGKNLQKGCSNPGSSTKDPLNRKPIRQIGCLAPSVLVIMETRDMFPSDAYWEVFQNWRNPCPNHPCLMLNQKGKKPLQLTPNIDAFGRGFARSPRNLPPDPVQQLPLGSLDGTQEIAKSKWELNPTLHEVLYLG